MKTIKIALLTLGFIAIALLLFILFIFDLDYELNLAKDHFLKGEYQKAKAALEPISSSIEPAQYALYLSYIAQAQKAKEERNHYLQIAENSNSSLEALLNKALYSYVEFNVDAFKETLAKLDALFPNDGWTLFLHQIQSQFEGLYEQSASIQEIPPFLNLYMARTFQEKFNIQWLNHIKIQNEINQGNYLTIRKKLDSDSYFLLGLTYLKEAESKPPSSAPLYLEAAFESFQKIPLATPLYNRERHDVVLYLMRYAYRLKKNNKQTSQLLEWLSQLEAFDEIDSIKKLQH